MGLGGFFKKTFGKQECAFCGAEVGMMNRTKIKNDEFICNECSCGCSRFIQRYRYTREELLGHMEYMKRQAKLCEKLEGKYSRVVPGSGSKQAIEFYDDYGMFRIRDLDQDRKYTKEMIRYDQVAKYEPYCDESEPDEPGQEKLFGECGVKLTLVGGRDDLAQMPKGLRAHHEDYMTPELMCGPEVYQDGVGLVPMTTWFMEDLTEGDEAYSQDLYPGETVQCSALFYLRSENPVEVVIESTNSQLSLGATFELAEAIAAAKAAEEAGNAAEEAARQEAEAAASEAMKALSGSWDRTDGWDDALEFRADGTGFFDMTGDVFPFSYTIDGQMLYLNYDDGDSAEYTYEISGDELILTDYFDDTMTFVRVGG